ncbi:unnamed protein product [Callosobruchus maculatus]|uniref:Uncharacterized protein n=1 Tax=Callosobruchus maculatus TaxID=64391 RepID=A0A653D4S0_CALMS|nr:unnamed protein product [Callosobruchus maculatus]
MYCYILYFSIQKLPTILIILNMASNNDYCCVPQCNSLAKKDTERKLTFHRFLRQMLGKFI